ncbi:MAG: VanZ family protein [Gemmatimonadota bacterium]
MSVTRRWVPSVVWGTLILIATSVPGAALPTVRVFPGFDKIVHASLYGVLGALLVRALSSREPHTREGRALGARTAGARTAGARTVGLALGAIALMAAADECHQLWIPGRSADALDWVADVAGATIGVSLSYMALPRRERRT